MVAFFEHFFVRISYKTALVGRERTVNPTPETVERRDISSYCMAEKL